MYNDKYVVRVRKVDIKNNKVTLELIPKQGEGKLEIIQRPYNKAMEKELLKAYWKGIESEISVEIEDDVVTKIV
jgi:hypothetical protein